MTISVYLLFLKKRFQKNHSGKGSLIYFFDDRFLKNSHI